MKTVLLAGASGYIGRAVARTLVRQKYKVIALVRNDTVNLPGCTLVKTEVTSLSGLAQGIENIQFDAVVSCIASRTGIAEDAWRVDFQANQNLLDLANARGVERFVLLSAICVQRPRLAFQHAKLAFEQALRDSGVNFTIVRPTAFFKSLSGQVERLRAGKPFLLFGDGHATACKPISESDLAAFMVGCLTDAECRNQILPIGGPGRAMTSRQQGELLFSLLGLKPRFRSVPPGLLIVIAGLLQPLGCVLPSVAKKAELARIGHYYATESMLLWDADNQRYDAEATPSTGRDTLHDHYQRILRDGLEGQELGTHKLL